MRVVVIGVSHWHMGHYLHTALEMPELEVVGLSDPDINIARHHAEHSKCKAWSDYREMCEQVKPDFAFALGKHNEMAAIGRYLIDHRIPFALEKPCGLNGAEVADLAERAKKAGVFATVPFVIRHSPMFDMIREFAAGEQVHYLTFKFVGGLINRYYKNKSEWMLNPATSGGGCFINLGIHCLDLCRHILGPSVPITVTGSEMSNALGGLPIEDHGTVLLRAGKASCSVETGYMFPAPRGGYDLHYSIRTDRHYFVSTEAGKFTVLDDAQKTETRDMPITNFSLYPTFVREAIRRFQAGEPPIADLGDAAAAMKLIDDAYRMSPLNKPN